MIENDVLFYSILNYPKINEIVTFNLTSQNIKIQLAC